MVFQVSRAQRMRSPHAYFLEDRHLFPGLGRYQRDTTCRSHRLSCHRDEQARVGRRKGVCVLDYTRLFKSPNSTSRPDESAKKHRRTKKQNAHDSSPRLSTSRYVSTLSASKPSARSSRRATERRPTPQRFPRPLRTPSHSHLIAFSRSMVFNSRRSRCSILTKVCREWAALGMKDLIFSYIECLGTVYLADPICDDVNATLPLEVHVVTFDSHYYTTNQGTSSITCVVGTSHQVSQVGRSSSNWKLKSSV